MKRVLILIALFCVTLELGAQENKSIVNQTGITTYCDSENGLYGYKRGDEIIIEAKYDAVELPNAKGLLRVYINSDSDTKENTIIKSMSLQSHFNEKGHFGYINLDGEVVVPIEFGSLDYLGGSYIGYIDGEFTGANYGAFSRGDATTTSDGNPNTIKRSEKYGIIDVEGNVILQPKFDYLLALSDSIFTAIEINDNSIKPFNQKVFYVDVRGNILDQTRYDYIEIHGDIDNVYYVEKDDKAALIDQFLKELTPYEVIPDGDDSDDMIECLTSKYLSDSE